MHFVHSMYMRKAKTADVHLGNLQKQSPLLKQNLSDVVLGLLTLKHAAELPDYPLCTCTSQVPDSMTTSQGHPIDSKTSTLTVGPQGPVLLQDFTFIDEMAHFDRERIPERVVHAKGAGRSVGC